MRNYKNLELRIGNRESGMRNRESGNFYGDRAG